MAPVPTSERAYLDQDLPVRSQNYVCLSFLSPEQAIASREAFAIGKFTSRVGEELTELFSAGSGAVKDIPGVGADDRRRDVDSQIMALKERYSYMLSGETMRAEFDAFTSINQAAITTEVSLMSDGAACVRGIKVRGVYETIDEAKHRCESLKRTDPNFSVFVAEVGCWCPWAPNPDDLAEAAGDQNVAQYSEPALNTLMQNYQENVEERDQFYNERKSRIMSQGKDNTSPVVAKKSDEHEKRRDIMEEMEAEDNWSKLKLSCSGADEIVGEIKD
jgi:hypothetical protein